MKFGSMPQNASYICTCIYTYIDDYTCMHTHHTNPHTQIWTCYICVLRHKCISFYKLLSDQGNNQIGHAGVTVAEKGDGHKIIAAIEPGSGADRAGGLLVGDVIVGVDGMSLKKMRACDVDALLAGPSGSVVRLSVCRAADVQAVCVCVCMYVCLCESVVRLSVCGAADVQAECVCVCVCVSLCVFV